MTDTPGQAPAQARLLLGLGVLLFAIGQCFETPLLMFFLAKIHILNADFFLAQTIGYELLGFTVGHGAFKGNKFQQSCHGILAN